MEKAGSELNGGMPFRRYRRKGCTMKKSLWMRLAAVFAVLMLAIAMATPAQAVKSITKSVNRA